MFADRPRLPNASQSASQRSDFQPARIPGRADKPNAQPQRKPRSRLVSPAVPKDGQTQPMQKVVLGRRLGAPNMARLQRIRAQAAQLLEAKAEGTALVVKRDVWENEALSHTSGLQILFLGTGTGDPKEQRRSGCLAMKLSKTTWLFDCGEDTQRQVHKQPLIRNGRLDRIFLTNKRLQNLTGLPGMLCTMSAARAMGLDSSDIPLHIYGPPGLTVYLAPIMRLSETCLSMPVIVHELVSHAISPDQARPQRQQNIRSSFFRVLIPPDHLNPQGWYDSQLEPLFTRNTRATNKMSKGQDERLNFRDLALPGPGDPTAPFEKDRLLTWTIRTSDEHSVTAHQAPAALDSWAYLWQEADRTGPLDPERCDQLGVNPRERGILKAGKSVISFDGQTVTPDQVIGEDIKGRRIAVIGECSDSSKLTKQLEECDVIIHAASCQIPDSQGLGQHKSCVDQAANLTAASKSNYLILYRFKPDGLPDEAFDDGGCEVQAANALTPSIATEESINPTNSMEMVRRNHYIGYIWNDKHARQAVSKEDPNSLAAIKATEDFAQKLIGREHCVSVAEDMDLYSVERKIPS